MIRIAVFVSFALAFLLSPAQAKVHKASTCVTSGEVMLCNSPDLNPFSGYREIKIRMKRERRAPPRYHAPTVRSQTAQYLPHPSGCPRRAFCGCGASLEVFGVIKRELWLAANWFKFPRTAPAPNTVAVRRGHVFVLKQYISGNTWLVADYNSGGHQSRLHARSIAGYTIVQPS